MAAHASRRLSPDIRLRRSTINLVRLKMRHVNYSGALAALSGQTQQLPAPCTVALNLQVQ